MENSLTRSLLEQERESEMTDIQQHQRPQITFKFENNNNSTTSLKKRLFLKPAVQQEFVMVSGKMVNTAMHEKHPSWFELMFDFVMVISAAALITEMNESIIEKDEVGSWAIISHYIFQFVPIMQVWHGVEVAHI